jgi:hypothetical protein
MNPTPAAAELAPSVLADALRELLAGGDPIRWAAVNLLIRHDYWLHDPDFRACVRVIPGTDPLRAFLVSEDMRRVAEETSASTTQVAILRYAAALYSDEYRFSRLDNTNVRLVMEATATALGWDGLADTCDHDPVNRGDFAAWVHACGHVELWPLPWAPDTGGCDACESGSVNPGDWRRLYA